MRPFHKGVLALGAIPLLLCAWVFRYAVVVGQRGDGMPPAYKLDRWTGEVTFIFAGNARPTVPPSQ